MSRNPAKIGRNLLISVLKKHEVYISKYEGEATVGLTPKCTLLLPAQISEFQVLQL